MWACTTTKLGTEKETKTDTQIKGPISTELNCKRSDPLPHCNSDSVRGFGWSCWHCSSKGNILTTVRGTSRGMQFQNKWLFWQHNTSASWTPLEKMWSNIDRDYPQNTKATKNIFVILGGVGTVITGQTNHPRDVVSMPTIGFSSALPFSRINWLMLIFWLLQNCRCYFHRSSFLIDHFAQ